MYQLQLYPEWSSTQARYFENQKSNFAMEIWNSGCAMSGGMDTDDGHSLPGYCHGWVMVRAENNIDAILEALKNGAFYSSCGPEIYDFYVKDGKAIVECSQVAKIRLHSDMHPTKTVKTEEGTVTCAEFDLNFKGDISMSVLRLLMKTENMRGQILFF